MEPVVTEKWILEICNYEFGEWTVHGCDKVY